VDTGNVEEEQTLKQYTCSCVWSMSCRSIVWTQQNIKHLKGAGRKVRWRCISFNKSISIACNQDIKCFE